jgi:hypothetical protein
MRSSLLSRVGRVGGPAMRARGSSGNSVSRVRGPAMRSSLLFGNHVGRVRGPAMRSYCAEHKGVNDGHVRAAEVGAPTFRAECATRVARVDATRAASTFVPRKEAGAPHIPRGMWMRVVRVDATRPASIHVRPRKWVRSHSARNVRRTDRRSCQLGGFRRVENRKGTNPNGHLHQSAETPTNRPRRTSPPTSA